MVFQREQYANGLREGLQMNKSQNILVPFVQLVQGTNGTFSTNSHRYIFENDSKKHLCPNCTKKRYVRYIDTKTDEYLPQQYGRCDREMNCSYYLNPYNDGYAKAIWEQDQGNKTEWKPRCSKTKKKPLKRLSRTFIPNDVFYRTRAGYDQNIFIQNLLSRVAFPFEVQDVERVISLYHLGTVQNGYRSGASTFPFIDVNNKVRAIQVKQFDEVNHTTSTDFLHSIIEKHQTRNNKPFPEWLQAYNMNETKVSCLFGEHLLSKYPHNPVALVEAPKTAIYGTLYFGFPEQPTNLLWLGVYNLSSLNLNKCKALNGRNVYLFPDLSKDGKAFKLWSNKATEIQKQLRGTYFNVSDLLEQLASEQDKKQGKDIADYLIKLDWRLFRKQGLLERPKPEQIETPTCEKSEAPKTTFFSQAEPVLNVNVCKPKHSSRDQSKNWVNDITELENYFNSINLPNNPVYLCQGNTITNISLFLKGHFTVLKANNSHRLMIPYFDRIKQLKLVLNTQIT